MQGLDIELIQSLITGFVQFYLSPESFVDKNGIEK